MHCARVALFVHFDEKHELSFVDLEYIEALAQSGCDVVFISNGPLPPSAQDVILQHAVQIIVRENTGYDFGAWQDAILQLGWEYIAGYDELILCNNSCVGPVFSLADAFQRMDEADYDFWGQTLYPYHEDLAVLTHEGDNSAYIPEHIQSYFMVFKKPVIEHSAFWDYWLNYNCSDEYLQTIMNGEIRFTQYLSSYGFKYGVLIPESLTMGEEFGTEQPQNELGAEYIRRGALFVKKKNKQCLPSEKRRELSDLLYEKGCSLPVCEYFLDDAQVFQFLHAHDLVKVPHLVSVVIPTKNAGDSFKEVLDALLSQEADFEFEIICIDSGSNDGTVDLIRSRNARLIQILPEEFGHGRTRNVGARAAKGDYVAFITQDALPASKSWLQNLVLPMMCDTDIVATFGRHIPYPDCNVFDKRDIEGHFAYMGQFNAIQTIEDMDKWKTDKQYQQRLCFFSDNNSCVRKSVFLEKPYPDVQFAEDQIWMRARLEEGYKKAYCADAPVYHSHNYKGRQLAKRYFDDMKGQFEIHGYMLAQRRKELPNLFRSLMKQDLNYVRSLPIGRTSKIKFAFEALSRNYRKCTAGYAGSNYHRCTEVERERLDTRLSQQKEIREG